MDERRWKGLVGRLGGEPARDAAFPRIAEAYREGRSRVLRAFLRRRRLYRTDLFEARLGALARANLRRALARPENPPVGGVP
ncbi:MAG: hypothetical protein KA419_02975 [Acidobacteria bacterium]|nr:hypothetical protein [Acidobacteriota bacterium]